MSIKTLDLTANNVANFGNASRAAGQLGRYDIPHYNASRSI